MSSKTVKTMTAPFEISDVIEYYADRGYDVSGYRHKIDAVLDAVSNHGIPLTRGACLPPVVGRNEVCFPMIFKSGNAHDPIWDGGDTVSIGFCA